MSRSKSSYSSTFGDASGVGDGYALAYDKCESGRTPGKRVFSFAIRRGEGIAEDTRAHGDRVLPMPPLRLMTGMALAWRAEDEGTVASHQSHEYSVERCCEAHALPFGITSRQFEPADAANLQCRCNAALFTFDATEWQNVG
jgi:hypothetical protein